MNHSASHGSKLRRLRAPEVRFAGATDCGLVRPRNEDAFAAVELGAGRGVLLAVSDGMGGHQNGDVASAMTIDCLILSMTTAERASPGPEYLRAAVEAANAHVWSLARAQPASRRMGATLTAVHVRGTRAHIAQVGDSRAYLARGGRLHLLTLDQTYTQLLVDAGVLLPDQRHLSPFPATILQAVGQEARLHVALGTLDLRDGDRLLVCSDGLTNHVCDGDLEAILRTARELDAASATMITLANERRGDDNITVVLGEVSGGLPPSDPDEPLSETLQVVATYPFPTLVRNPLARLARHA